MSECNNLYADAVRFTHVPDATEHTYTRVDVLEPSVRMYNEPLGAACEGAPEPASIETPVTVTGPSNTAFVVDDTGII